MTEADKIDTLRRNTAKFRLLPTVALVLRNLQTLANKRAAMACRPGHGAAIVCSAGPSLDHAIEEVKRRQGQSLVIAVNTAVGALLRAGVTPDVVVSTEHVDVSKHAHVSAGKHLVTCLGAAESVWERATHWVSDTQPYSVRIARELGVRPLWCSGNVAPTAISLALEWGADPLVLVGQDLAYSRSGQCYATGASWDKTTAKFTDRGIEFEHMPERQRAHISAGVPGIPTKHEAHEVPGWGGMTVRTTVDWIMQRDLIAQLAAFHPGRRLINATGGGVSIDGWQEQRIGDVGWGGQALEVPECDVIGQQRVEAANAAIRHEMDVAEKIARDELDNDGRGGAWLHAAEGLPICMALGTPDWLQLQDLKGMAPSSGIAARYSVWEAMPKWAGMVMAGSLVVDGTAEAEPTGGEVATQDLTTALGVEPRPASKACVGDDLAADGVAAGETDHGIDVGGDILA